MDYYAVLHKSHLNAIEISTTYFSIHCPCANNTNWLYMGKAWQGGKEPGVSVLEGQWHTLPCERYLHTSLGVSHHCICNHCWHVCTKGVEEGRWAVNTSAPGPPHDWWHSRKKSHAPEAAPARSSDIPTTLTSETGICWWRERHTGLWMRWTFLETHKSMRAPCRSPQLGSLRRLCP